MNTKNIVSCLILSSLLAVPAFALPFECKLNVHSKAPGTAPDVWTSDHIPSKPGVAPYLSSSVVKAAIDGLDAHYAAILSPEGELEIYVQDDQTLEKIADVWVVAGSAALSRGVDLTLPLSPAQKEALHRVHPELAGDVTIADIACSNSQ